MLVNLFPMFHIIFFLIFSFSARAAGKDICDILDLPNCSGVSKQNRRTSNLSLPSPATAANLNPANVSVDRGFGGEVLLQPNNSPQFNLVSGSGRFGGALISPTLENSFFGVRSPELDENFLERNQDKKRFDPKKLNFALAGRIVRQKNYGLDFGILVKRHSEVKKIRWGLGLSGRAGPFTFGASQYKDDFWIDYKHTKIAGTSIPYSTITGMDSYSESYRVTTVSAGVKLWNLSLDAGEIYTDKYKFTKDTAKVRIYSAALAWQNFLFNFGQRREDSFAPKFKDDVLKYQRIKKANYAGIQYSWWRPLVVGVHYNYFLLNEVSLTMTIFIR